MNTLPNDFDVALIGDDSHLEPDTLALLRELAWRKAAHDVIWFMENFWSVIDPQSFRWVPFLLRDYQVEEVEVIVNRMRTMMRPRDIRLKARQIGWTTMGAAIAFHDAYFTENHPWLLASQGQGEAIGTLQTKVKQPYLRLPTWMRERGPRLTDDNSEQMTFDNGSSIVSLAATSSAGRSKAVYGVLLDEFAFAGDPEGLHTALDPLCYGPLIIFSTANGMGNPFHSMWLESQRSDSEWHGRFLPWHVVPGRDEKWYKRELRKFRGKEHEFYQEYPSDPEEAFMKSGNTALPVDLLRECQDFTDPEYCINLSGVFSAEQLADAPRYDTDAPFDNLLYVWTPPTVLRDAKGRTIQKPNYVVSADIAELGADRTSITVWDANAREVVATFLGHYPVEDLGELLEAIGYWYHTALVIPERNNHGILPTDYLRRAHYPRLYRMRPLAQQVRGDKTPRYGFHTNKATKPMMIQTMVKAIRDDSILVHDSRFLVEAMTFVADGKGGYAASDGNHDDHVMSHLIGLQGVEEVGEYPIVWIDDSIRPTTMAEMLGLHGPQPSRRRGMGQHKSPIRERRSFVTGQ